MRKAFHVGAFVMALTLAGTASADIVSFTSGVAHFTSDLQPSQVVSIPTFDLDDYCQAPMYAVLDNVTIEIYHSGSVIERGDNDDPFNMAEVQARMIRNGQVTGPDAVAFIGNTINTPAVQLDPDNGDLTVFDPTPPDGVDFGQLQYSNMLGFTAFPTEATYSSNGPSTIDFTVTPSVMVNDQQFVGPAPDAWQLEVEDPMFDIWVEVTYDYRCLPEPGSLALLALGGFALIRRR